MVDLESRWSEVIRAFFACIHMASALALDLLEATRGSHLTVHTLCATVMCSVCIMLDFSPTWQLWLLHLSLYRVITLYC